VQGREVDPGEGLLDEPLLLRVVERPAQHLLGGEQGQVGDLLLDAVERLLRLRGDRLLRGGDAALPLLGELLDQLALLLGRGRPGVLEDLRGLPLRGGQLLLVLVEQPLRLLAGVLRGLQVLAHGLATLVEQRRDPTERVLAQDHEHDQERDQRPQAEAELGLDQPGTACLCEDRRRHRIRR
jgi:hypothetical protein